MTIFSATAVGNATPLATLKGPLTAFSQLQFPAVDTAGNLYASDEGPGATLTSGFINVFAPTMQSGNQRPIETFGGMNNVEGIAFDTSGDVYIGAENAIDIYPPGSTNMMAKITGLNAGSDIGEYGIFIDAKNNLYVAESSAIAVYAPGATGAATPVQEIDTGNRASGISSCLSVAADSQGQIYCANFQNSTITRYAAGASGSTAIAVTASDPTLSSINEPFGIFIDAGDIMYVANYGNSSVAYTSTANFATFAASASVLSGSNTGLNYPYGVYVR